MPDTKFAGQRPGALTPVKDPRTGRIIGYRDRAGRSWNPDGSPRATGLPSTRAGAYTQGTSQATQDAIQRSVNSRNHGVTTPPPADPAAAQQAAAAEQTRQANIQQGTVWVNGQRMRVVAQNPDGSISVAYDRGTPQNAPVATAFGALDDPNATGSGDSQFLMSIGPRLGYDNFAYDARSQTRVGPDGKIAYENFDTPNDAKRAEQRHQAVQGQNRMTVQSGVQWLANLSTRDPEAYSAMVEKLHDAGYLSDAQYANAAGNYSSEAGAGFAIAARDLAVVNQTAGGESTTLDQFLTGKAGGAKAARDRANAQAKADAWTPIDRKYTDPAGLKEQAKAAAERAIGRQLTPEEEQRLTDSFRGQENAMYDQIDAAGQAGTAATVTVPDATGQIDQMLDSGQLEQEQANFRAAGYGQALMRLMGVNG